MQLHRLYPRPGETTPEELIAGLDLGSRAPAERPYVICNMVASLDGKATVEGTTRALGGDADRELFHQLRTQADAVLVGAGTVRAEHYGRPARSDALRAKREREGLDPETVSVIVSGRLDLSPELPVLADTQARVIIATSVDHELEGVAADVTYLRIGDDLRLLLALLRSEHGIRSALCEGGPTLNSHMLAAAAIDELFLSLSPQVTGGDAYSIVEGRELPSPSSGELVWLCESAGELFSRWRLRP